MMQKYQTLRLNICLLLGELPNAKTFARKPKVPGSSPATSYVQRWALYSNRLANV